MLSRKLEKPLKIVLDTNNLVSSQINKKGASFEIFNLFAENKISLYTSPFQLRELERVLNYQRIRKKYRLTAEQIKIMVSVINQYAKVIYPTQIPQVIKTDSDDNQILAIAKEGKVDFIVSGDEHLLKLKRFVHIPIITARNFLRGAP